MSASNSEDNRDPDQDTDNPLPNQGHANAAQPGDTAEDYVPWFGDSLEDLGLIPRFLASEFIGGVVYLLAFVTICIPVIFFDRTSHAIFNMSAVDFLIGRCFNAIVASVNWSPLIAVCWFLLSYPQPNKFTKAVIVIGACLFGLLSWGYCALVSSEKHGLPWDITIGQLFETWSTGTVPQSFRGCDTRVEPNQAPLFETDIYYTQFARTWHTLGNFTVDDMFHTAYDMERFSSIQANQTLCAQGFEGNNDLYGLGLRTSLYVQWLSSFLANNFLPGTRQNLQIAYLIFSLAICLATIISSFIQACVFSIEIEIMYWMYWGGYVCVFAAAPCPVRLGSDIKWIKLDWITAILFTTHILMIYHGVWFVFDAYDQVFSRMPCGTYHFFLFPILDPSEGFWTLRDYLTNLLIPFVPALLAIYPVVGLALASEVKYTIQNSTIYQTLFLKPTVSDRDQRQTTVHNAFVKISPVLRAYLFITRLYRRFREFLGFPSHRGGGIRLVTPIDVRDRRLYRIRCLATGLLSYILSVVALEVILKWNKVTGVYSIASTGQYVALIIGAGGFVSVIWTLVQQESERRRNLQRRQFANQDEYGIELDSLSHNLSDAISHAFSQPDIGFSTNGGPFTIDSGEEAPVRSLNTLRPSPNIESFMSGALNIPPDLEAQPPPTG